VKNGMILQAKKGLAQSNKRNLQRRRVTLSKQQQGIIRKAIFDRAKKLEQKIFALSVSHHHVHIVAEATSKDIREIVKQYKNSAQLALFPDDKVKGRVWTRGYDKRYCYDTDSLKKRIYYVRAHNKG